MAWGQTTVTDELTYSLIGVSSTTYSSWSGKTSNSSAVYAGQSAGGNNSIQLRSKNSNSGIVTTTSGGKVKSVTITFNTNTSSSGQLDVYGKNTAYTSAEDLYKVADEGTKLGSAKISEGNSTTISITDDYEFIGFRSYNGAVYIDKIEIVWETGGSVNPALETTTTINVPTDFNTDVYTNTTAGQLTATVKAGEETISDATVSWSSSNENVATIDESTGEVTLVSAGTVIFTARYAGVSGTYQSSSDTYEMTVTDSTPFSGGDVTFVCGTDKTSEASLTKNGVTMSFTASGDGTWDRTDNYRLYANKSLTISTETGTITKIAFTISQNNFSGERYNNTTKEWTGNAKSVTLAADGGQVRFTPVVVTVNMSATPDPTFTISNNEEIAYNATSGSFDFTVNNPVNDGVTTVSENVDWISDAAISGNSVSFNTTVNNAAASRSGVITLTYTYGTNNETVTKEVTVTQAGNPNITNIPDLFAAANSTAATVSVTFNNWVVSGVSTDGKNVFVTDGTNGFVIFDNAGGLNETYSVGSVLSGTAVPCQLVLYNGFAELTNIEVDKLTIADGGNVTVADITLANLAGVNTGALVSYENLTCSVVTTSNGNTNYFLSDGTTDIQVYTSLYNFGTLEDGKTYNITGIYQQFNKKKEILPRSADDIVVVEEASITVNPNPVEVAAAGGEGTIDVTYNYITEVNAEVQFFAADGTTSESYDWIEAELDDNNNIYYVVSENTSSEARTAYLKVYALDDNAKNIYSDLITITQAAAVTPGTGDQYALFNGDLVEGDYIIYYNGKAMNTTVTSDRLQYEEVSLTGNVITTENAAIVWHIAKSGDYWTIYNAEANAYAAGTGAKNKAQMLEDGTDDKALWTVSGTETETYEFVNKKNTANSVNAYLRNNGTYGFACYSEDTGGALSLYKKVEAITLSDVKSDDLPESANPANVTLTRKFVNKWNPICLPFDVTDLSVFGEGYEVVKYTGDADNNGNVSLKFETVDKMDANVPYMVWVNENADVSEPWVLTFNGVNYNPSNNPVSAGTNYNYVGVYKNYAKGTSPIVTGDVILSGGAYKTVTGNGGNAIKGFRGYWKKSATAGEAKSITAIINGQETDDIKYIELVETLTDGIFNLQGQKVNHAQKGVFIVNGKKVVIK